MNSILILREEIVCLIIILYLLIYTKYFIRRVDMKKFEILCVVALIHVIFDIITVITVNSNNISYGTNLAVHLIFFDSAILFSLVLLSYTLSWVFTKSCEKRVLLLCRVIYLVYLIIAPFLGIEISQGDGTKYSSGYAVTVGYAIAFIFTIASFFILIIRINKINKKNVRALIPMSIIMIISMTLQIIMPEFLFTGAGITIVTIGVFFAMENPTKQFMQKAYHDFDTGVKNKNCFEEEFFEYKEQVSRYGKIGIVVCDLNGLKLTNDTYGHGVGDKLIITATQIMKHQMHGAKNIYRVGGDEFVLIYLGEKCKEIQADIYRVEKACEEESEIYDFIISIAMGYAINNGSETLIETYRKADLAMYQKKVDMKEKNPKLVRI